jgi:hypothetical protein
MSAARELLAQPATVAMPFHRRFVVTVAEAGDGISAFAGMTNKDGDERIAAKTKHGKLEK